MNLELRTSTGEHVHFSPGFPDAFLHLLLPDVEAFHSQSLWGTVAVQQVSTGNFLQRIFLFLLKEDTRLHCREKNEGLQSLLCLDGRVSLQFNRHKAFNLAEMQFTLLDAADTEVIATLPKGRLCRIWNTYYHPKSFSDYLNLLPAFRKDLLKTARKPLSLFFPAKTVRFTVADTIKAILVDRYHESLQKTHIEAHLKTTLNTILAQTYTESGPGVIPEHEHFVATAAREQIMKDITQPIRLKELAEALNTTRTTIRRAFNHVYGVSIFKYLRIARMEKAKQMLLKGHALKYVAPEVGMKARNFPKLFKAHFGYTVTEMKKGLV